MKSYEWLNKKTPRSVDQLKLWPENPRLNPEEDHIYISDFVEDLTFEKVDRDHFFALVKAIAEDGFIPADPIVVWKSNENGKYYVAEGNRRILALKLLRDPEKAPKSIRSYIRKNSQKIDKSIIEKVMVNVAPTFEDAEWYINQRNSTSSLQRPWSRIQQQRWIAELYEKYDGDIEKIYSITKMTQGPLESFILILKIKDLVNEPTVRSALTIEEFEKASSYKFPITILERFFYSAEVKEKWGIDYDGIDLLITSNRVSFLEAYAALIKRIVNSSNTKDNKIDTRTITTDLTTIIQSLPVVKFDSGNATPSIVPMPVIESPSGKKNGKEDVDVSKTPTIDVRNYKNDPNRKMLVLPIYRLNTDSYRLQGLFEEFQKIPYKYINSLGASLRVFLDLAVFKFIESEGLESVIGSFYKMSFKEVSLKYRIEYLKSNKLKDKAQKIAIRLIDPSHQYSLDVLNGFIHSQDAHYLNKQFLNGFWDFLFPLLTEMLDIQET